MHLLSFSILLNAYFTVLFKLIVILKVPMEKWVKISLIIIFSRWKGNIAISTVSMFSWYQWFMILLTCYLKASFLNVPQVDAQWNFDYFFSSVTVKFWMRHSLPFELWRFHWHQLFYVLLLVHHQNLGFSFLMLWQL